MEIILTEDVAGLGDIGEEVRVRPGYARNFLIPRGLAIEVEAGTAGGLAHRLRQLDAKKRRMKSAAEELAGKLSAVRVSIGIRVGKGGKVFGSVTARMISEKLLELGYEIDRRRVMLSEPIKKIGTRDVAVKLHAEVQARISVQVTALEATEQEEEEETELARHALEAAAVEREAEDLEDSAATDDRQ